MIDEICKEDLEILKINLSSCNYVLANEDEAEYKLFLKKNDLNLIKCKMCDPVDKTPMIFTYLNVLSVICAYQVGHNTYIISDDRKEYVICNYSLTKFIKNFNLNSLFLRVSRESVINIKKISKVFNNKKNNKIEIILIGNIKCCVNKSYKNDFLNLYCNMIGNVVKW